ncbi:MAG: hypothetical protein H7A37_00290 [Chlamydiales bacterium]|nr:hypothetical protein [Chlamydiia bacterium]MCP5506733.1 hypothetical protein [Chlamydiales bacterium]
MKIFNKIVAVTTAMTMLCSPIGLKAEECYSDCGGCGYTECRRAPCIAPCVALGVIALAAIIAIAVQTSHSDHNHAHCHSTTTTTG